jgi:PqqD family protein of HPr-rel-A system
LSQFTAGDRPGFWRRPGPATLHYRQWQDEVVLFNDISGATHLLTLEALVVLEHMGTTATSETALAAVLREHFDVEDTTLSDDVADLLGQLSSLDLIEPCPL